MYCSTIYKQVLIGATAARYPMNWCLSHLAQINTTENAYILIEYSYAGLLCHHDKSLLCYRFTFFCGCIRLKSFHQTSDVFLAVLKPGDSLVTMTNDDKKWLTTTIHSEVQRQWTAQTCYHICNKSINLRDFTFLMYCIMHRQLHHTSLLYVRMLNKPVIDLSINPCTLDGCRVRHVESRQLKYN